MSDKVQGTAKAMEIIAFASLDAAVAATYPQF